MIPTVHGVYRHTDYIPDRYSPKLLQKFYDNTILSQLTNNDYEGDFKKQGGEIIIRERPNITSVKYKMGQPLVFPTYRTESRKVKVERMRSTSFHVDNIEQRLTDLKGFVNEWTDDQSKNLAIDIEKEFFEDVPGKCDVANQGDHAGLRTRRYNLGEAGNGVQVSPDTIVNKIVECSAVMAEQPGGLGPNPYLVLPVWAAAMLKMSDLNKADAMGDTQTSLRTDISALGKIAGFTIFQSNLLDMDPTTLETPCIFGSKDGITFAKAIEITEVKPAPDLPGDNHYTIMVYDWFSVHPEKYGTLVIKPAA